MEFEEYGEEGKKSINKRNDQRNTYLDVKHVEIGIIWSKPPSEAQRLRERGKRLQK